LFSLIQYYFYKYFYGRYSTKLHDLCEQNNYQTPYDLCFAEDPADRIQLPFNIASTYPMYHTKEKITFEKIPYFSSFKNLKKRFGNPGSFVVAKSKGSEIKVYGYKKREGESKVKLFNFFIDDQFFMGEYCYNDYSDAMRNTILRKIGDRYFIKELNSPERFYISDDYSGMIYFEDNGFSFAIRYLSKANSNINLKLETLFTKPIITVHANSES
jgi:hypothetical protein